MYSHKVTVTVAVIQKKRTFGKRSSYLHYQIT